MNSNRILLIACAAIAVAVLIGGWFLGIGPQLAQADRDRVAASDLSARNDLLTVQIAKLKAQDENLTELETALAEAQVAIPGESALDDFVVQLVDAQAAAGVTLTSVDFAAPLPFAALPRFASIDANGASADSLVTIAFTVSATGGRDNLVAFADLVGTTPRLSVLTSSTMGFDGEIWGGTVQGIVYVLLAAPIAADTAVVPTPTPEATPAP